MYIILSLLLQVITNREQNVDAYQHIYVLSRTHVSESGFVNCSYLNYCETLV